MARKRGRRPGWVLLLLRAWFMVCLLAWGLQARAQSMELHLDSFVQTGLAVHQLRLRMSQAGPLELEAARLQLGEHHIAPLRLHCRRFSWQAGQLHCREGRLQLAQAPAWPLELHYDQPRQQLRLDMQVPALASLAQLLPELADWQLRGRARVSARHAPGHVSVQLELEQAAFGNAAGTQAGEGIDARMQLTARQAGLSGKSGGQPASQADWQLQASLDMPRGQLFFAPLYRDQPLHGQARGRLHRPAAAQTVAQTVAQATVLQLDDMRLELPGWGNLAARLDWRLPHEGQPGQLLGADLLTGPLQLAEVLPQLVQPYLGGSVGVGEASGLADGLTAQGSASLGLAIDGQGLERLDVELDGVSLVRGQQGVEGMTAHIPWRREVATQADIRVAGAHFGQLKLGAFTVPLVMQGLNFAVRELAIPVLDGRLVLENFHLARRQEAWHGQLAAAIEPVSMPQLSTALGWPQMAGVLSASIPQISYRDATLQLDGQLVVSVFDGYLSASRLRVVEPFGRLPRLQADVMARHIDLGMLTRTFSFGDISGYVDADIAGLEMHGYQPLAFAAELRSSAGDYPRRISQRALQNISALGGAGAAAALQRSFLRIFESFGYQRLGWRCQLRNGVCQMGGISAADEAHVSLAERLGLPGSRAQLSSQAYQLVQGGGLPALNVIGYNRRVDWLELTSRLQAVIDGNTRMEMR